MIERESDSPFPQSTSNQSLLMKDWGWLSVGWCGHLQEWGNWLVSHVVPLRPISRRHERLRQKYENGRYQKAEISNTKIHKYWNSTVHSSQYNKTRCVMDITKCYHFHIPYNVHNMYRPILKNPYENDQNVKILHPKQCTCTHIIKPVCTGVSSVLQPSRQALQ
jgi:hypothetical protein